LATLPLPFVLGWLADRVSRKPLILACLAAPAAGLMVQVRAAEPWQFWVASALSTVVGASVVVAAAVVTDALPADAVAAPLGLLNATPWIGIVLGLTLGGAAIDALGMELALRLGVVPAGVAVVLLLLVALPGQVARRQRWPATTDSRAAATRTANVGAKGARV
jgi:MFS family permease